MNATQLTHPQQQVLYRLDGGAHAPERILPLRGYRHSSPVRVGNAAITQRQLDIYGDLLDTAWTYATAGHPIDRETGRRLAEVADLICQIWHLPDAGIWEVRSAPQHFTQSKMMCWVGLDRAIRLADQGYLPAARRQRWLTEATAIRTFIETHCWSNTLQSYVRAKGSDEIDASLLLMATHGYGDPGDARLTQTVKAIENGLGSGPLLRRYLGEDGLPGSEGYFLTCSFWLVHALVKTNRVDEAVRTMETLLLLANDVGLYAEESDPVRGEQLGNTPQGLVHLALINAAVAIAEVTS